MPDDQTAAPASDDSSATGPEPQSQPDAPDLGDAGKAAIAAERAARKAAEKKAASIQAELDEARKASMSEQERAIAEVKAATRAEVLAEVGTARAADAIRLAATGRLADAQVDNLIEGVDLKKFVLDDGSVDRERVTKFVDGIAPQPTADDRPGFPDLGQGARGGGQNSPLNGDPLLRDLKAKLGIR